MVEINGEDIATCKVATTCKVSWVPVERDRVSRVQLREGKALETYLTKDWYARYVTSTFTIKTTGDSEWQALCSLRVALAEEASDLQEACKRIEDWGQENTTSKEIRDVTQRFIDAGRAGKVQTSIWLSVPLMTRLRKEGANIQDVVEKTLENYRPIAEKEVVKFLEETDKLEEFAVLVEALLHRYRLKENMNKLKDVLTAAEKECASAKENLLKAKEA